MLSAFFNGKKEWRNKIMKNTVILEMINNGEIKELKNLLQDEIYNDSLKEMERQRSVMQL